MRLKLCLRFFLLLVTAQALFGCTAVQSGFRRAQVNKQIKSSDLLQKQFTGFALYDPTEDKFLIEHNDHLLFTPASTTKVLTTLACLQAMGDSIPAFEYFKSGDSVFLKPLADATFLYPDFSSQKAYNFLKEKTVLIQYPQVDAGRFGSGWAWDDYQYAYQAERSWFPIYGNVVRIFNEEDSMRIVPEFFGNYTDLYQGERPGNLIHRWEDANVFSAWIENDTSDYERKIPFKTSKELLAQLLNDTLNTAISFTDSIPGITKPLYSQPTLETLSRMMLPSDNFLAEHLLMQCGLMEGYYNTVYYQDLLLRRWSSFLPDEMRWEDGSGLSRYNLISPRNMIGILATIYHNTSWNEIERIFPTGGVSGTIKNWYEADEPYVFAKTGTLSNNHNLCGFIKTQSGKTLIFSFMNNHYTNPVNEVKSEMERVLRKVRDTY